MSITGQINLICRITFTQMKAKLKQTFIATAGVIFGITVFIFLLSYVKGINGYVKDITLEQTPHIRLYNESQIKTSISDKSFPNTTNIVLHERPKEVLPNIKDGKKIMTELKGNKLVKTVSGTVNAQVFYSYGSTSINGMITGIIYKDENELFNLEEKFVEGNFSELVTKPNSLAIGSLLAKRLNIKTGDKLRVTTEKGTSFNAIVVGIFKTGIVGIDKQQSYANIKFVRQLLNVPESYITEIKLKLNSIDDVISMTSELETRYETQVSNWKKDNAAAFEGEALEKLIVYSVAFCILMVAGFGIFNILNMMSYEKIKDIAILKAMGFSNKDIYLIFLSQALVIGFIGSTLGLLFGFLASYGFSKIPYESDISFSITHIPISFDIIYYIIGFSFGIITTSLSGYTPSRKAAKTDPISILKS